jgi:hypothetical protein
MLQRVQPLLNQQSPVQMLRPMFSGEHLATNFSSRRGQKSAIHLKSLAMTSSKASL